MQRLKSSGCFEILQTKAPHGTQTNSGAAQASGIFFLSPVRSMFWWKTLMLPCMQTPIPHKLLPLRSNNLLYLLETCCKYNSQCQLLINKEICPLFHGVLFCLIKDIVKASTSISRTRTESVLNLAVFASCLSTTCLYSPCLTAPLKWLPLSGWWND